MCNEFLVLLLLCVFGYVVACWDIYGNKVWFTLWLEPVKFNLVINKSKAKKLLELAKFMKWQLDTVIVHARGFVKFVLWEQFKQKLILSIKKKFIDVTIFSSFFYEFLKHHIGQKYVPLNNVFFNGLFFRQNACQMQWFCRHISPFLMR